MMSCRKLLLNYQNNISLQFTLLPGGSDLSLNEVVANLRKVVKNTHFFSTNLILPNTSPEFFRAIFLQVDQTQEMMNFATAIQVAIFGQASADYFPHLSLLYGNFNDEKKQKTVDLLGRDLHLTFTLEKIGDLCANCS